VVARTRRADSPLHVPAGHRRRPGDDPLVARPERARQTAGAAARVDQASQLSAAVRLAYCQPYIGAFFNFLLADERALTGWQSGLLWANWQPKPSYYRVRDAVFDVADGSVDCTRYPSAAPAS